ncbi:MAG: type II secretion system minor pseudopilin GspJ [bacterium]
MIAATRKHILLRQCRGFTFIEVMVSVGVFAVIAMICYATLSQYLKVREGLEINYRELQLMQRTLTLLERDLRYMVNRPVRSEYGDNEVAFIGDIGSVDGELFRITVSAPDIEVPGNTRLQRIAWRLVDGALYRDSWQVLDRVQDSEPRSRLVLRGVSRIDILHYQWTDSLGAQQLFELEPGALPYATELLITMDDEKNYRRIFDLANGA